MRASDTELAEGLTEALREAAHRVRFTGGGDPSRHSAAAVRRRVLAHNDLNGI